MRKPPTKEQMQLSCREIGPEDGVDPAEVIRSAFRRKTNHKSLQLCRRVERTVGYVLAGDLDDDRVRDMQVVSVVPAPNSHHLLVTLEVPEPLPLEDLSALDVVLARYKGRIRTTVAHAIHRKKAPDLTLVAVNPQSALTQSGDTG